jgi:hypothetical protein
MSTVPAIDEDVEKKKKLIEMECYMLQEMGEPAPSVIPESKWEAMLKLPSASTRQKYFLYLLKMEKARENEKVLKANQREAAAKHREVVLEVRRNNKHYLRPRSEFVFVDSVRKDDRHVEQLPND